MTTETTDVSEANIKYARRADPGVVNLLVGSKKGQQQGVQRASCKSGMMNKLVQSLRSERLEL